VVRYFQVFADIISLQWTHNVCTEEHTSISHPTPVEPFRVGTNVVLIRLPAEIFAWESLHNSSAEKKALCQKDIVTIFCLCH